MKNNAPKGTLIIFGLVGLVFTIIGVVWLFFGTRFVSNAQEVYGRIVDITSYTDSDGETNYRAYVDYRYNKVEYENVALNSYSHSMKVGKKIKLLVNPENPGSPQTIMSTLVGAVLFLVFGLILVCIGFLPMFFMGRVSSKAKRLMNQGHYIIAKVESVHRNNNIEVGGKTPYVVYCNYQDIYSGTIYRFKSKNIWYNPEAYLQQDAEVRVYVNGQDYSDYYVDVESAVQGRIVDYT